MNRFRSVHWRIAGRSSGLCVGRELRYGDWRERERECVRERESSSEPRGLNVNCGLRHFTRMPLLRAAMQPSCWGVPHQVSSHCRTRGAAAAAAFCWPQSSTPLIDYSLCIIEHICINNIRGISEVNTSAKRLNFQFLLSKKSHVWCYFNVIVGETKRNYILLSILMSFLCIF